MTSAYRERIQRYRTDSPTLVDYIDDPPGDWGHKIGSSTARWHLISGIRKETSENGRGLKGQPQADCNMTRDMSGLWEYRPDPPRDHEPGRACLPCLARWQQEELERMPARRVRPVPLDETDERDEKLLGILWREAKHRVSLQEEREKEYGTLEDRTWSEFRKVIRELGYEIWLTR